MSGHGPPLASSVELANSVYQDRHAGAPFPFFDIVEALVPHSNGDELFLSSHRDKDSSIVLGLGSWVRVDKLTKGIASDGDH